MVGSLGILVGWPFPVCPNMSGRKQSSGQGWYREAEAPKGPISLHVSSLPFIRAENRRKCSLRTDLDKGKELRITCSLSKNFRGRNTSKLILWSHHHPDNKCRQRHHKKRKLPANIMINIDAKINKILTEFSNTFKRSYTMIKSGLSEGCKDSSVYANQSMWYTISTNWKINITW